MCIACERARVGRRGFLALAGMASLAGLAALAPLPARAAPAGTDLSPDDALKRLKEGNARYMTDAGLCATDLEHQRAAVSGGQKPWAAILSCADSRVPPELVFGGLDLGQLFIMRNAGNVSDTNELGTLEYGVAHLGVPLIVVMGHQHCGAVAAACDVALNGTQFPGSIGAMIEPIVAVAKSLKGTPGDLVANTIRASARHTAETIPKQSAIIASLVEQKRVKIVPAVYALDNGQVEFLA